jgi:MATE family multidrug resistance protein
MSTSGFTAQAYGEKNKNEAISILIRALLLTFVISCFILALQSPIAWGSFLLIGGSPDVEILAEEYFRIRVWAAPAALSLFVFSGWFLGMQNARYPMIIAILVNLSNIVLSVFFVHSLHMKSDGVALGTAISQYIGLGVAIFLLFKKYRNLLPRITKTNLINFDFFRSFFKVNSDIFIRTMCIILVFTFFTSKSASINDTILAVNSILLQFLMFFSFFIDGFAFAGEALVGKFIGRQQAFQLKKVVKLLMYWGIGLAGTFTLLYIAGVNPILNLLTSQQEVIDTAQDFLFWVFLIPIASFGSFVWDGIYIGATASKPMRNSLLVATFLIFAPVYFFLSPYWENHALWLGMLMFMLARGVILTFLYKKAVIKLTLNWA